MNILQKYGDEIRKDMELRRTPPQFDRVLTDPESMRSKLIGVMESGYDFDPNAIEKFARDVLKRETNWLTFERGVYLAKPIQEHGNTTVTQIHERAYLPIGDPRIPVATWASRALAHHVGIYGRNRLWGFDVSQWEPTEAGYQRYDWPDGHISPHRDRRTDQLLGATLTLEGSAVIKIHEPKDDPDDYTNLELVNEFETRPGSLMLLRAPGAGNGKQIIHEVLPPKKGRRLVLNLRMRPDVLKAPGEEVRHE